MHQRLLKTLKIIFKDFFLFLLFFNFFSTEFAMILNLTFKKRTQKYEMFFFKSLREKSSLIIFQSITLKIMTYKFGSFFIHALRGLLQQKRQKIKKGNVRLVNTFIRAQESIEKFIGGCEKIFCSKAKKYLFLQQINEIKNIFLLRK